MGKLHQEGTAVHHVQAGSMKAVIYGVQITFLNYQKEKEDVS